MDKNILENLNEAQLQAVTAAQKHLLILAGAGSGKTRVLVHRIAWLVQTQQISPYSILAVTFTNKAANEMRGRIEGILNTPIQGMWVGTFHGLAHRLLRQHWQEANLPQSFQILDADDQLRLVRRVINNLNLDEGLFPPKQALWFINAQKDEGKRAQKLTAHPADLQQKTLIRIYVEYETLCTQNGVIDFAEILLRAYELWRDNPELHDSYQRRFPYVLVDEFQDTNTIQYAWLKLLAGEKNNITIVGDDDQSIYGWRGAKIENIQRFTKDFPQAATIRLEQNYRSTGTILAAANALISNNDGRLGKNLWTETGDGELISLYSGFNDLDEARFVIHTIQKSLDQGLRREEIALLYRSNAQSRLFEEALIQAGIPYRVYGGFKFFDRAEIKDAIAYLRLINNPDDDAAFERIYNTPTRGIGEQAIATLREQARAYNQSLWRTALQVVATKELSSRALNALSAFLQLINSLAEKTRSLSLHEQTEKVIQESGLIPHFEKEKGEKAQARIENLQELVNVAGRFRFDNSMGMTPLSSFLSHVALEAGDHQEDSAQDCVQLMTLHSAKGLEFPIVFLCGLEEGLFPHHMSVAQPGRLEEERRLCYVGMTRAMRKLYVTYAEARRQHGETLRRQPSRFIKEIPEKFVDPIRLGERIIRPASNTTFSNNNFSSKNSRQEIANTDLYLGQRVVHPSLGEGIILNYEGQGAQARVQVKFTREGTKWLIAGYANLTPA